MKTLQDFTAKLREYSRYGLSVHDMSDISNALGTQVNLVINGKVRVKAIKGEPRAEKAPRGVDVTMYLHGGKLKLFNKQGEKIYVSELNNY